MSRTNLPWGAAPAAKLHWSADGTPNSTEFGDVYYSREGGLDESRHVFLRGNGLPERWQQHPGGQFVIAEAGFGTGLNFLLTWQAWSELPQPRPRLHYLSIEKHPLQTHDLARALAAWPTLREPAHLLLAQYPGLSPGQHRIVLEDGALILDLWWEDIAFALTDLARREQAWVDAWYLDGFAPARNEAMWQPECFDDMARLSREGASFSTFTAAGAVRRSLEGAGFEVHKAPGFGRKRECLRGRLNCSPGPQPPVQTPWDLPSKTPTPATSAIVIGGGLAGCHVAAALARRGVQVDLLEQCELTGAGSGNEQGVLYTRLSRRHSPLTDFALQSFGFASRIYGDMFNSGQLRTGIDGGLCGSFQQSDNEEEMEALEPALLPVPYLARILDPQQANAQLGITQPHGGYWFPRSGWLNPPAVCRALLASEGIRVRENCGQVRLEQIAGGWLARAGNTALANAEIAVIATGTGSTDIPQLQWLPLQSIRGQTSSLPSTEPLQSLQAVLCHEGYIPPARGGFHCIGATFNLDEDDSRLRTRDHRSNLRALARAVPDWADTLNGADPASLEGRVGYRCASPDYLPLAGPVPDLPVFLQAFAALRKNARQNLAVRGDYLPGLYLSTGHGSRGLTSTPLAAELLASQITGEPPPLCSELTRALAPARFLVRDLGRNRI